MDRAVQIAGTTYESVPSVTIPTTGGGEASFVEISDTTALAADVASGKFFYTADGIKTQGTASGGGTVVIYKDTDGYIVIGSEDCGVDGLVSKDSDGYIVIPEELITEIKLQGKNVVPTEEYQAIYPDSGYDGLEYVGVDPIPSAYADVTDTTAVATDVAAGKIFYTSEGVRTSGTASGGGGGVDYASGTYTPASAIRSFTVPVDFEPEFALVVADPEDFVQDSSWKESMFLNDFTTNWNFHAMTRWLTSAYNSAGGAGTENMGTYSDGVFTFNRPFNLNFVAGITYRWYLWRETT